MTKRIFTSAVCVVAMAIVVAPLSAATVITQFAAELDASIIPSMPVNDYTATATFTLTEPMVGLPTLAYSIQLYGPDLNIDGILPNGHDPVIANQTADEMDDVWGIHLHYSPGDTMGPHVLNLIGRPANDDGDAVADFENDSLTGVWDDGDASGTNPPDTKPLSDYITALKNGELVLVVHTWGSDNGTGLAGGPAIGGRIYQIPEPSGLALLAAALGMLAWRRRRTDSF
ncbi:MAG: CHRD domain-containing protein [Planctomycetales bacterium]|nr:CHRD domain-containing protein [Planctomycetales bacterium]